MMPKILFLLADYPLAPLNHKKRRLDRLFSYLSSKGTNVYVTLPDDDGGNTLNASHFPDCTLVPWGSENLTCGTYSSIVIDGDLPRAHLPALPETYIGLAAGNGGEHEGAQLAFLPDRNEHALLLPLPVTDCAGRAKAANFGTTRPGMLMCAEANDANIDAVQAFCSDIWPTIHEMCPSLVLRLPEEFLALGVADAPGLEWIKVPDEEFISHHIRQALMAVIPAVSPAQMITQHADYARHALPCLCAGAFILGCPPPLEFCSPEEAALQAYRLMTDSAFHGMQAKRIHEFGMTHYSHAQIFEPLNRLLVTEGAPYD